MEKIEAIYHLSPLQQGMLFHSLYAPGSGVYVEQLGCSLRGELNVAAFERAWQRVVDHHPVLRTAFVWEEMDEPVQVVRERASVTVERLDWRAFSQADQREHLERFLEDDCRRGFDLLEAPLMRIVLIQLDDDAWRFVWTHHHILLDGWSLPLLLSEVFEAYRALREGREASFESRRPYRDYIAWLRRQDLSKAEAYWRRVLAGFTAPTPIPVGPVPVPAPTPEGDEAYEERGTRLSSSATEALRLLAARQHLTLSTFFQGAWALLLSRYCGEEDILFGVTVSGRPPELTGVERMVGLFINTLPLRVRVQEKETILAWLRGLQEQQVDARTFEYTPLSQVQGWSGVPRGTPLFDSILVFENYPMDEALTDQPCGLEIEAVRSIERTNYPLTVAVVPGRELIVEIGYDARRFDAGTIERMLGHLVTLLEAIAAEPESRLSDLPLLTAGEHSQILAWSRPADAGVPRSPSAKDRRARSPRKPGASAERESSGAGQGDEKDDEGGLHRLFEAQARRSPAAIAVEADDGTLTYEALNHRANRLAGYLLQHGVGVESCVGICLDRSAAYVVAVLAALKAGACWLPLDPRLPGERLAFLVEDAHPAIVLTDSRFAGRLEERRSSAPSAVPRVDSTRADRVPPIVLRLDSLAEALALQADDAPSVTIAPANLAYIIYTSGSTGRPKGVMVPHGAIGSRLRWGRKAFPVDGDDRLLQKTSIGFDVSVWEIFAALTAGARLVVAAPAELRDTALMAGRIAASGVTIADFIPSMLRLLLDEPALEGRSLRRVSCGGEAMPADLPVRFFARLSGELLNFYGPTETAVDAAFWSCVPEDSRRRSVPIGRPIGNARLYIVDRALRMVPVGVPGELCVGGEGLARGYLRRPDLTAERFVPDPFSEGEGTEVEGTRLYRTGDRVRFLPDGTIEFLGRIDRQLKIRGHRIEPGEIEAVLREHPSVGEVAVVSRVDPSGVPSLVAYIGAGARSSSQGVDEVSGAKRAEDDAGDASPQTLEGEGDDLRAFLEGKLPAAMIPAQFVSLAEIPRTPSGKVDIAALPDPGTPVSRASFMAPRDPTERILAEIWAQVLGVESVGVHDNFFELGGDSILSMQVASKARARGIAIAPRQVFDLQTISDLAVASAKSASDAREGGARPLVDELDDPAAEAPLTPIQCWFFEQELPEPDHWNQAVLLQARRTMDATALRRALEHVALHHDALRMRFRGGPSVRTQKAAEDEPGPAFEVVDLSSHPSSEHTEAIEEAADRAQRGLDIARGPLVRAVLYELGAGRPARLLIVIHHLVVDGVSWRILLEDLETVYGQIVRGKPPALPAKTMSFGRWASRLTEHARSGALRAEAGHWLGVTASDVPPLPGDGDGENLEGSAATIHVSLDPRETRALLNEVPAAYRTEINDVLLTALAQAFARWTGSRTLLVDLEGHGREAIFEDVDLSRTVGWFTTVFPVRLDLPEGAEGRRPGPALKAIKEQLRAVPGRGIGYGLLRYSGADPEIARRLSEACRAEVSFNYMGQLDGTVGTDAFFAWAPESAGVSHSLRGQRSHAIEVNAQVTGGRLEVEWTFGVHRHRRSTIESVAGAYLEALRGLIEHCRAPEAGGFTPSDFPQAHLSQKELDDLLARLGGGRGRTAES